MKHISFSRHYLNFGPGDVASFDFNEAAKIVKAGAGRILAPGEVAEASRPVRIDPKPERMLKFSGSFEE